MPPPIVPAPTMPTRFTGAATVSFENGCLSIPDLAGTYVSPDGHRGPAGAAVRVDFLRIGTDVDFTLRGQGLRATKEDLRHILEPDVVESVVEPFEPAGVFDFVVEVSRRAGLPVDELLESFR